MLLQIKKGRQKAAPLYGILLENVSYITNLSSESDGRMRLTATGVPRQQAFKISPKDPCQHQPSSVKVNLTDILIVIHTKSCLLISRFSAAYELFKLQTKLKN